MLYHKAKRSLKSFIRIFFVFILILNSNLSPVFSLESAVEVNSPSAILVEANTGHILYQKEPDEQRSCASITKIMTALLVMESLARNEINLDDEVTASEHAQSMGGSQIWLKSGETMSIDELLKALIIASANDAAVALAEHLCTTEENFVKKMNERAKELGMTDTTFKNCNGLDEDGHLTTAEDISIMARELLKHKTIFKYTTVWIDYLRDGKSQLVNTNRLIRSYEGITGLKTGTTDDAGCCICATAKRGEISLVAVVLGAQTSKERFKDAATLLDYGFNNFVSVIPKLDNVTILPVKVKGGFLKEIKAVPSNVKKILIPRGMEKEIKTTLCIKNEVLAPVARGQVLGKIEYKLGDEVLDTIEVTASEGCQKVTFKNVFKKLLEYSFKF